MFQLQPKNAHPSSRWAHVSKKFYPMPHPENPKLSVLVADRGSTFNAGRNALKREAGAVRVPGPFGRKQVSAKRRSLLDARRAYQRGEA